MESWWMRASAKGIVQSTDLVAMGMGDPSPRRALNLLHHPTGVTVTRTPDWVVLAVPARPVEWLYHAAVIEGDRAGASSGSTWHS